MSARNFTVASSMKNTLSIRNFKGFSSLPSSFHDDEWKKLEPDLIAILNNRQITHSLEKMYRTVETISKLKHENIQLIMINNLKMIIEMVLMEKLYFLYSVSIDFLNHIDEVWKSFCKQIKIIKNIFISIDRSFKFGSGNINFISLSLFKNTIILNKNIKANITKSLINLVEIERNGTVIKIELVKSIMTMLMNTQVYEEIFQNEFVRISDEFYENEGNRLMKSLTVPNYLKNVDSKINEEEERGNNYTNVITTSLVVEIIERRMIQDHKNEILNNGFESLIENDKFSELTLLYNLIERIPGGASNLSEHLAEYITKRGDEIMNSDDQSFIENLLKFKRQLNEIIEVCFMNSRVLSENVRKCFSKFINSQANRSAQLLAKYVDQKLRSKNIKLGELESSLNETMTVFRLIQGKDIFEAFYKKDLAKRLLLGKSTSQDAENSMVAKLKYECGANFTSKIEGMFNDISISWEINSAFKQYLINNANNNPDLSINVLTNSFWPNYPNFKVNLPLEFIDYQNLFQKFYSVNHCGKKLLWQPSLGFCILRADFENGNKELQVSLFQTLILLLFNQNNRLTYCKIKELTNLDEKELNRTLISLSCGRSRVLLKNPKGIEMNENDEFLFNRNFTDRLFRIRINQIQLKETKEEEKATERNVLNDRQFQIDAAIVRIMKSYKCISHTNLISELFNHLAIPLKPSDLKKRIELLIEREYMERDKDNAANYNYIA